MSDRSPVEESLLRAFREEFQADLALIRDEWERFTPSHATRPSDLEELRRALHTLKGSTRLLGFAGLPEQIHVLEETVLSALSSRQKPAEFWDGLADLEEAVSRALGTGESSLEMEPEPPAAVAFGALNGAESLTAAPSSSYGLLLAVDELVALGQRLARDLEEDLPAGRNSRSAHRAALLVERSRALRQEARRLALVPSRELFAGLTELARRSAAEQGKTVRVVHQVAPDQLERDMVQALRPALLHLVGNAVVHGVEARGEGVISLRYQRLATALLVAVADNGRGLSREALGAAVVEAGHLTLAQWEALGESEQLQWVFHPGISTRSEADLSAGRGMGMAVVSETVQRLGGRVEIETSQGTEFRLLIPTNWNLRSVLAVRSGGHSFAVLRADISAVEARALGQSSARPLGELCGLLGYPGPSRAGAYRLLLERTEGGSVAVGVDEVGDFEDVLVTPLMGFGGLPPAIVGVTPQSGQALPVISLKALADLPAPSGGLEFVDASGAAEAPLLLVVDDSLTTRTLVTGILKGAGYRVVVAADGRQALEVVQSSGSDLAGIVCDYQMPVMDGLEFLEQLRSGPSVSADVPFVLLTSIDDVATFEKASGLGADRCLGKQNFSQDLLLKTVGELL